MYIHMYMFSPSVCVCVCVCVCMRAGVPLSQRSSAAAPNPPISSYSAVWPGVIFPTQDRKKMKEEGTQVSSHTRLYITLFYALVCTYVSLYF